MRDQILTLASELIAFPSTKNNPEAIADCLGFIADELKDFTVIFLKNNESPSLLITNTNNTNPNQHFKYLLNGHIDVVAGSKELFQPHIQDGKLLGRGSADMKGPLAALIYAFKTSAPQVSYPLALQIVADEEIGGFDGTLHQVNTGVTADFVIVGEKTDFNIGTAAKGLVWLKLTTHGKAAHGAYPWEGKNAILSMNKNLAAIAQAFPVPQKEAWQTTCNISVITAGNSVNQTPDKCTCHVDIRRVPEDSAEEIIAQINDLCTKDTTIEVTFNEPALFVEPNHPEIVRLQEITQKIAGATPKTIQEHGGSDARHFMHRKIPAICFGPIGGELHSQDEWVDIASLETQAKIMRDFLRKNSN